VAVLKDSCDIQKKQYSSDSCGNSRKSSCSGQGCCTVLEKSGISVKAHEEDSFPRLGSSTSLGGQGNRRYKPKLDQISNVPILARDTIDVEKGLSMYEHVILSVQGMTCTGCETKLFKSLSSIPSVTKLQTSLVLSLAEFDIDAAVISPNDAVAQLERMTGFKCERITIKGQELDVLITGNPNALLDQPLPPGVTNMSLVDDKTIRIYYDAKLVGARDLFERGFSSPLQLAPLRPHPSIAAGNKHVRKVGLTTLVSTFLTIPVLIFAWAPLSEHDLVYGSISLALATIIQVLIAGPFYLSSLKGLLFARVIEVDLLIVLSTSAAYIFSVVAFGHLVRGNPLSTGEFFETSTLLVTLIMVGRFISALARQKAVESISIRSLQATTTLLVTDDSEGQREIDTRLLQYGDVFKVVPDSRVATDGTVISGTSEVDESMVTGEPKLVEKEVGSPVVAGSVNSAGSLYVRVTRLPGDNTISTIAGMVDEAKLSKPKTQEIADRVAGYFVPVVVMLTIITFVIWIAIGVAIRKQSGSEAAVQAITFAIAVLIVSCPCAIGLAVPMVIVVAGGVAADYGVVFKTAETLEIARKTSHVVFDKTGTLTQGKLAVSAKEYPKGTRESTMPLLLGLISNIKHPVSTAVANYLNTQGIAPACLDDIKTVTGKGVEGVVNGSTIRAGNSRWLGVDSLPQVRSLLSQGFTVFCVVIDDDLHAIFGLEDSLRPDATSVVSSLVLRGIIVSIVSGDDDGAVQTIASKLGIPPSNAKSRCSSSDKQKYVQDIIGESQDVVIFCGDGTNDAVALAQASIGVHVNEGTDVAQSAADAVLTCPALTGILVLIDLSRAAFLRIVFNFSWAFIYNLFAILLAAGAFVNARIPPQYAGLGEVVSVLPVIAIALQLKYTRFGKQSPSEHSKCTIVKAIGEVGPAYGQRSAVGGSSKGKYNAQKNP
jgi:heavy metal translocating P-type ATPase